MQILKWLCFIFLCIDVLAYIVNSAKKLDGIAGLIGLGLGIVMRVFVLYGTLTCWLLA